MARAASSGFNGLDYDLLRRSREAIAHGALTNSKRPECLVRGAYPTHLKQGRGCYVWDTKGNRYIDFICGLGTKLLGHAHPQVTQAITTQLQKGICFSLGTEVEVQFAEKVKEMFPFADRVRILKTGSEACSAALRMARVKTGRYVTLSAGYHGWHDEFTSLTPPARGVPPMGAIEKLSQVEVDHDTAAVILEPVELDSSPERIADLRVLRAKTAQTGTVLIFDEIITGLRYLKGSVSNCYGISPDVICLGKAIGNGMPLAVVAGRKEVLDQDYFVSSTYAGEALSLTAGLKVLELLQTKYKVEDLWEKGKRFIEAFNTIDPERIRIDGYPTRGRFQGDPLTKALFWQECAKAGILFGPSFFIGFPHVEVLDQVLNLVSDIYTRIRTGQVKLEGEMPETPFAQKVREAK